MTEVVNILDGVPVSYQASAVYYDDSDSLEFIALDVPAVYRRVDDLLTLILAMDSRKPIGFKIKGFRNFCNKHLKIEYGRDNRNFIQLVRVVEIAMSQFGDVLFVEEKRRRAYQDALNLSEEVRIPASELKICQ